MKNNINRSLGILVMIMFGYSMPANSTDCASMLITDPTSNQFLTSNNIFTPSDQDTMNCYAWQMFISLNWPVDSRWPVNSEAAGEPDRTHTIASWGVPDASTGLASTPTVWESFKVTSDIFLAKAKKPTPWGVIAGDNSGCTPLNGSASITNKTVKHLVLSSKNSAPHHRAPRHHNTSNASVSDEIMQATGGWLTDQSSNLVYYERSVGKAEFDYIMQNQLYNADKQYALATNALGNNPSGFILPEGELYRGNDPGKIQQQEDLGSFELKAAWRILTGQKTLYPRYLTTLAYLTDPETKKCSEQIIGLVGLHIIHKTPSFPDFVWTTFEHIDNVPDANQPTPAKGYAFNNPHCDNRQCPPNKARISCQGSQCNPLFPMTIPVQVTREQPATPAIQQLNSDVQSMIRQKTGGKSVFQYYQFINVLWDASPNINSSNSGPAATIPIRFGTFTSQSALTVANTTLETYAQQDSCNDCHQNATIAGSNTIPANFSFIFDDASSPRSP
ncbi:hypothetical protein SIN8267_01126 [Sinobacterium norvegicum]|uniref:Cytochrome c family protein n=1 Tax=Sinobacterium norvegicum TaxID=1641715 RepID=A0ABN8EF38_9GAMM|nr:hypothetical protein [Sinobacterium norvegicum]CAH0991025.1 hypothetical protein SIN8267_01126 [Sinobacterium norvegicum]